MRRSCYGNEQSKRAVFGHEPANVDSCASTNRPEEPLTLHKA